MAVFTPVALEEARHFLQRYDLGGLKDLVAIAEGVENTNYRLETGKGRFVLTLFEKRVEPQSLPFRLGLTEHLALRRYPAPRVRRDREDRLFSDLNQRPAAILDWRNGEWLRGTSESRRCGGCCGVRPGRPTRQGRRLSRHLAQSARTRRLACDRGALSRRREG